MKRGCRITPNVQLRDFSASRSGLPPERISSVAARVTGLAKAGGTPAAAQLAGRLAVPVSIKLTRSEEHTSELPSLMRISYAVFCLTKKKEESKKTIEIETRKSDYNRTLSG